MSRSLTASDRASLIRLASSLPAGSPERRSILTGLQKISYKEDFRDRHVRLTGRAKQTSFTFRNQALRDLWEEEFTGQISDGMWENTPGTGWEFWVNVPTSVGSKTQFNGVVPYGVKQTFGFNQLIPLLGDRMLQIIQKTEPTATMATVSLYTKEIMVALRSAKAGKEAPEIVQKEIVPLTEGAVSDAELLKTRALCLKVMGDAVGYDVKPIEELFMLNKTGLRDNKYHYFVVARSKYGYSAISAYGAIGKVPKAVVLVADGGSYPAMDAVKKKATSKLSSGYIPVPLPTNVKQTSL